MANIQYRTKGNSSPNGKPRVYFTCHPDDFNLYFDSVCDDIFKSQNCAIYYKENDCISDEDLFSDLLHMNLFVIPVTKQFLSTPNPALDEDFRFAVQNHIPVLPLMQETGLDALFAKVCGDIQYLDKTLLDRTAISYEKKLEDFLNSVLIGDELAEQIRSAFDAYVFLSYRKKDRKYANDLMRLIHKNDFCRDIAIWYDEFLTPGEDFNASIQDALLKSDLFVLTVTPNLVNETNYIMTTEYPMAMKTGKPILPAEMVRTDKGLLANQYQSIPSCADAHDESALSQALLDAVKRLAIQENDHSPQHNFFIGLAYLSGIDMEVDHTRAVELITSAAEAGLVEAVKKLMEMYRAGLGVVRDYNQSMVWNEKLLVLLEQIYREDASLPNLARLLEGYQFCGNSYKAYGNIPKAKDKYSQCIFTYMEERASLENDKMLLVVLDAVNNCCCRLADLLILEGDLDKAQQYYENALKSSLSLKKILDGMDVNPLRSLQLLACTYISLGSIFSQKKNILKARECFEQAADLWKEVMEQDDSAVVRQSLAICYSDIGDTYVAEGNTRRAYRYYSDGMELHTEVYAELGTPSALVYLADANGRIGDIYFTDGNLKEALPYYQKRLKYAEEVFLATGLLAHQRSLAYSYLALGKALTTAGALKDAWNYFKKCIELYTELVKESDTPQATSDLAAGYEGAGLFLTRLQRFDDARAYYQKAASLREPLTQKASHTENLIELANDYDELGILCQNKKALQEARTYFEKALQLREGLKTTENGVILQRHLAISYERIADLLGAENKHVDACAYYQKSLAIYEEIRERGFALAILYAKLARAMTNDMISSRVSFRKRTETTAIILDYYEKSIALQESLLKTNKRGDYLENLAITYCHMANLVIFKKKYIQKALEIYEELCRTYPDVPR